MRGEKPRFERAVIVELSCILVRRIYLNKCVVRTININDMA